MPTQRITDRFDKVRAEGRAALVTYMMAGDPDIEASFDALCALRDNGADIIELGAPFTDPMADGPAIQMAGQRSLKAGTTLADVLALAARFREDDRDTPLILMGYANPVFHMGYDAFAEAAAKSGIDGTIIVDLPPEEDHELRQAYEKYGISVIRLATPTTSEKRIAKVAEGASGFLYYVAVAGVTGAGSADPEDIRDGVERARRVSGLPVCVGFGVRTGEQAAAMARIADGVVVGSAFVDHVRLALESGASGSIAARVGGLAKELSTALKSA
ncbi:tryptophan synthase subunit alpha [Henriciella pelagia]|jgi:tryptophan synthase alpha chain|uniref:Tryptophan synthase alpha chain n=1 Tax=Henriciella pelagia TaxID=1977912 RepID=A0ABQ1JN88_9PROT|nr:tryptophan synthase subunit alpha [Henriciella pelagia]GGB71321.1 tryptophan synthase alpha chain [Henriciella pelagia]